MRPEEVLERARLDLAALHQDIVRVTSSRSGRFHRPRYEDVDRWEHALYAVRSLIGLSPESWPDGPAWRDGRVRAFSDEEPA